MSRFLTEVEKEAAEALLENLPDTIPDVETDEDVREAVRTLEEHARFLRRVIGSETRFIEGPKPLPVPRSWAEIEGIISPIGLTAWPMFNGYARAAAVVLNYPHDLFVQTCAGVALRLRDEFDPSAFPPPFEDDFAKAFAVVLNGVMLKPSYTDEERELVEDPFATKGE